MGYYYEVKLVCQKKMRDALMESFEVGNFPKPNCIWKHGTDDWCYVLEWNWVKGAPVLCNEARHLFEAHEDDDDASDWTFKYFHSGEHEGDVASECYYVNGEEDVYDDFYWDIHMPGDLRREQ